MIWTLSTALAYSPPSGMGTPAVGGAFAGPGEDGAAGLVANPAAAHPATWEVMLDVGTIFSSLQGELDGVGTYAADSLSQPLPTLAVAVPVGPVGIGVHASVPIARSSDYPATGAQRYHSVEGSFLIFEEALQLAYQPADWVTLGAGGRALQISYEALYAYDGASVLIAFLGSDAGVPIGSDFLEGTQQVDLFGTGLAGSAGIRLTPAQGPELALSWRSGAELRPSGPVATIPSSDLSVVIDGTLTSTLHVPQEAWFHALWRLDRLGLSVELGWVDWSANRWITTETTDLTISGTDDDLDALFTLYGINEPEAVLDGVKEGLSDKGMHDVFSVGVGMRHPVFSERAEVRVALTAANAATESAYVHPGNLDFATLDTRAALLWDALDWLDVGVGTDLYLCPTRVVEDSILAVDNEPSLGASQPSGNGTYSLLMLRSGLSLIFRRPPA